MRILLLHNRYQQKGGEDSVLAAEAALLAARGHEVRTEIVSNDDIDSLASRMRSAVLVAANPFMARWADRLVADVRPDVVHIHNFFPLMSPSVHRAAAHRRVAVVQTLHNFRLLCAAATLFRDDAVCEECLGRVGLPAIVHGCYRGSRAGSAAVVAMQTLARVRGSWTRDVDRFVALTRFARAKLIEGGLPGARIAVKPNFIPMPMPKPMPMAEERQGALFVGRLSREKGVDVLIDAWREIPDTPLTIIGTGPLEDRLRSEAPANVWFAGAMSPADVFVAMTRAALLIVPSLWYEGFPMVLVEAAAAGLPVLASRIGSLAEIVDEGKTGHLFAPGSVNELATAVRDLVTRPDHLAILSKATRTCFVERYSPEVNGVAIEAIYGDAIANVRATRGRPDWKTG